MGGVIVKYKGSTIADLVAPSQKTLQTSGHYCDSDVSIQYVDPDIEITPVKDGKTRLYLDIPTQCDLSKLIIPLYWNQSVSNGVTVDWGDGSDTFQSASTGNVSTSHTYEAGGLYVVTMTRNNDCVIMLGHNSSGTGLLGTTDTGTNTFRNVLSAIETGDGVTTIRQYCFQRNTGLKNIILGRDITTINNYAFNYDYGVASIHFLGPTLPANSSIGTASVWSNVPVWCKIYVPPEYIGANGSPQGVPSRLPSTSTYTYDEEPHAYSSV